MIVQSESRSFPVVVRLSDECASVFAPVAGTLLAGLAPGGVRDVRCSSDAIVMAGAVEHIDARVAVAVAIERFAAQVESTGANPEPVALWLDEHPGAANGSALYVLSGLVCEGLSSHDPNVQPELVERFVRTALRHSSGPPLRQPPALARFDVEGYRYVAFVAPVDYGVFLRQSDDATAFVEALREATFSEFFPSWPRALEAQCHGAETAQVATLVTATLPLLGTTRDDVAAYAAHLQRMLLSTAHFRFAPAADVSPVDGAPLPWPPQDGVPDLHLCCVQERHYDCTRAALLAQLVDNSLHYLAANGATDGSLLCGAAWPLTQTCGLDRYVVPLCAEETLYAFTAYVDEFSAARHPTMDPAVVVSETQRCISIVLDGVPDAQWWCPDLMRLQLIARVSIATDPRTGRRFYVACGVLESAEACRWWSDSEVLRQSIDGQMRLEDREFRRGLH